MKKNLYNHLLLGFLFVALIQNFCNAQTVITSPINSFVGKSVHSSETVVFQSYAIENANYTAAMADLANFNISTGHEQLQDTFQFSSSVGALQVNSNYPSVNLLKLNLGDAGYTDLVYAFTNNSGGITLAVPQMEKYPLKTDSVHYTSFTTGSPPNNEIPRIKMAKADFNGDGIDECVVAYTDYTTHNVMISIYGFDANRTPVLKASASAGSSVVYSDNEIFDIKTISPGGQPVIVFGTLGHAAGNAYPQLYTFQVDSSTFAISSGTLQGTLGAVGNFSTGEYKNFVMEVGNFDTGSVSTQYVAAGTVFYDPNNNSNYIRALDYGTFNSSLSFSQPVGHLYMDTTQNFNSLPAVAMRAGDLDGIPGDELVFALDNAFNIFRLNPIAGTITNTVTGGNGNPYPQFYNLVNNNYVDIEQLYNDFENQIIIGFVPDNGGDPTQDVRVDIEAPTDATLRTLHDIYNNVITTGYSSGAGDMNAMAIAFGEFQGGSATLGAPKYTFKTQLEPMVVINTPPYHFDTLPGIRLDVNSLFSTYSGWDVAGSGGYTQASISSQYNAATSNSYTLQTNLNSSWGVSSTLSGGGTVLGIGLKASVTARYGENFSSTDIQTTTETISTAETTGADDAIYGLVSNFDVWEYPLDSSNVNIGYVLSLMRRGAPLYQWMYSKDAIAYPFGPDHEIGNILSYSPNASFAGYVGLIGTSIATNSAGTTISATGNGTVTFVMDSSNFASSSVSTSQAFGVDASASASLYGFSLAVDGNYSDSNVITHTSTASSNIQYTSNLDYGTEPSLPYVADYTVRPAVYWGLNGAINLNYSVDPSITNGGGTTLWSYYYGQKPDLSLILPWRLDKEKGYHDLDSTPQKKYLCKSLFFDRDTILQGDTLTITAFIQNYSLMDFNDSAQFQFYLGEPGNGGQLLSDINGNTTLTVQNFSVAHQGRSKVVFKTKFTQAYASIPQIFIVIDPNNLIDEIHEDNNMGTNIAYSGVNGISTVPPVSIDAKIYPNPASNTTQLDIDLAQRGLLNVTMYNELGQPVKTLYNQQIWQGHFILPIDTKELNSGTYLVKVSTDNNVFKTVPLVVIK